MTHRYLRTYSRAIPALVIALALLTGMLEAGGGKNDKQLFKEAQAAEQRKDWDKALELYLQALDKKPADPEYLIAMRRARFQAGEMHVSLGQKLRSDGKLKEAMGEFQKALIADPSSSMAIQEMKRTQQMIDSDKKGGGSKSDDYRGLTLAERAKRDAEERMAAMLPPPDLKPVLRTVGPLKINNQPMKVIFETVGKLAGVNVLFDAQLQPPTRNFNVDLPVTPIEQAFDYLAVETHMFWKPVSGNTIFVAEDNATKHRDYDDEVVKTIYATNTTSVQEFQELAAAVRSITEIRRTFTSNAQRAILVRGSADAVALAEKVVRDLDKPKGEVVIDVIVMQASSSRTRALAASIVNSSGTAGLSVPFAFTPTNPITTTTGTTGVTTTGTTTTTPVTTTPTTTTTTTPTTTGSQSVALNSLAHLSTSDFSTSLPGGLLNLMMTDSKTKVLNSPTVRASDGMKVSLAVGQKIPYATGSFQPGVGTVGVSPLVSTQFNFIDVGVNLDITPQIHSSTEVTLHVEINVSSVANYVNLGGGLSQPVVSQNKNIADIRLREGEVNILGGLSSLSDSKSINGIPGLTSIPVLGSVLFGSQSTDKEKSELLIALIPHIIRTPDYSPENLRGIYAGSDANIKLNYSPRLDDGTSPAPAEAPKPEAAKPLAPPAGQTGPELIRREPVPQPNPEPTPPVPGPPPAPVPAPGGAAAPGGQARITFAPATLQIAAGNPAVVSVQVENASDLFSGSPIRIKYDPAVLRLNEIAPGDLFTKDGVKVTSEKDIRNDTGDATLTVSRLPGSAGISGTGAIETLNFVAVGKGTTKVSVIELGLKNSKGEAMTVKPAELTVQVQ
jgi:general secretion pathway protein D